MTEYSKIKPHYVQKTAMKTLEMKIYLLMIIYLLSVDYLASNWTMCWWADANCWLAALSLSSSEALSTHLTEYLSERDKISFLISSISALKIHMHNIILD